MMLPPDGQISAETLGFSKVFFPYIANGVAMVEVMQALPEHVALRDRIATEDVLGPRLILSWMIDGLERGWPPPLSTWVKTAAEARQAVSDARKTGYDKVKVYSFLSQECYDSIIATAKELNMLVDGHIPVALSVEHILEADQNLIAHAEEVMKDAGGDYSEERIDYFAEIIAESDTWITPTPVATRAILGFFDDPDGELAQPEVRYLLPVDLSIWSFLIKRYQGFSREQRAQVDSAIYDAYVGEYDYGNAILTVTKEGIDCLHRWRDRRNMRSFPSQKLCFSGRLLMLRLSL